MHSPQDRHFAHMLTHGGSRDYHSHRLIGVSGWVWAALKPASPTVLTPQFLTPTGFESIWRGFEAGQTVFITVQTALKPSGQFLKRAGGFKMVLNMYMYIVGIGGLVSWFQCKVLNHVCIKWDRVKAPPCTL